MPRCRMCRRVQADPGVTYFKPCGVPRGELVEAYLAVDGYEALRLADLEGLTMEAAAGRMGVSRHTFGRILAEARRAVADAIVNGLALRIGGGHYVVEEMTTQASGIPEEDTIMKIAVTSDGPGLNEAVDPRFGRAAGFVVVDPENPELEWVDNGASQAMSHGAGINAAERIAASGAQVLLTGYVGPKAFQALQAAGIRVVQDLDGMTVAEAVERFRKGDVTYADAPNK